MKIIQTMKIFTSLKKFVITEGERKRMNETKNQIEFLEIESDIISKVVDNLRELLEELLSNCSNDLSGRACEFIKQALKENKR